MTEVEFELLFVKLVGVNTRTFGVPLIEKSGEGVVELLYVPLAGLETETPGGTLVDNLAEVEVGLLRVILVNVATETLDDDELVDKFTDVFVEFNTGRCIDRGKDRETSQSTVIRGGSE